MTLPNPRMVMVGDGGPEKKPVNVVPAKRKWVAEKDVDDLGMTLMRDAQVCSTWEHISHGVLCACNTRGIDGDLVNEFICGTHLISRSIPPWILCDLVVGTSVELPSR